MSAQNEADPYELLQLTPEATGQDIRKAYRKLSLKVHPDRNPDNPKAAQLFHELTQAYEALLDPVRRIALDAKRRLQQAKAERFKNYDAKRKAFVEELEERERELKRSRVERQKEEAARFQETERIKDEGRRMREERERAALEKERAAREQDRIRQNSAADGPPPLGDLDLTVRLKYSLKAYPALATADGLVAFLRRYGEIDTGFVVVKLGKKKATALVPFKDISSAFGVVGSQLDGIEVSWASGAEPELIQWLKRTGKLGEKAPASPSSPQTNATATLPRTTSASPADFTPPEPDSSEPTNAGELDYESLTLLRLRQAERERLEREILQQEAADS
ncbi:DnaJ-domain-containing protein [Fistulina hepatica ATCC 64428]|uniref:DnaJ-domain-containing protein n=1 Tax=Fistulina hepatica ATCC 64428 TaxID=1128425 RepID=A0A0D7ABS2_9AGAR|nr:DnaJ-domain-containing protein [Fistulina hepatica ATCC 64428]